MARNPRCDRVLGARHRPGHSARSPWPRCSSRSAARQKPGEYTFSGSGLGLSICRKLVEAMGSVLQVETAPGYGTRFYFVLDLPPRRRAPVRLISFRPPPINFPASRYPRSGLGQLAATVLYRRDASDGAVPGRPGLHRRRPREPSRPRAQLAARTKRCCGPRLHTGSRPRVLPRSCRMPDQVRRGGLAQEVGLKPSAT